MAAAMHRNVRSPAFAAAFKASVPVLLGYVTIGIAFGLLFEKSGQPWWLAVVMSLVVYAGAAQFMAVGLLASGTSIASIAVLTLVINARHMVYGLSLLDRFAACKRFKPYLVFALTDETYGILTTVAPPEGSTDREREDFYAAVAGLDQSYWVFGSALGALIGGALPFDTKGIDFALTALFIVLLVEQIRTVRRPAPYLVAAAATALAFVTVGPANLLIVAILVSIVGILPFRKALA
jgi:Predicted branched-chain amino acid permease (azaleucine resistance)